MDWGPLDLRNKDSMDGRIGGVSQGFDRRCPGIIDVMGIKIEVDDPGYLVGELMKNGVGKIYM